LFNDGIMSNRVFKSDKDNLILEFKVCEGKTKQCKWISTNDFDFSLEKEFMQFWNYKNHRFHLDIGKGHMVFDIRDGFKKSGSEVILD